MPNYQQGKIYTIRCYDDPTQIYVGSTTQVLSQRWGGHKRDSLKRSNRLVYQTINNEWDKWYIELYEEFPCDNKEQLCKREGEVIREIGTLNMCIAGRTGKQYRQEIITENMKRKKQIEQEKLDIINDFVQNHPYSNIKYKKNNTIEDETKRNQFRKELSDFLKSIE